MSNSIYLIIGASGKAGQCAIQAIRKHKNSSYPIVGTTSGSKDVNGCDFTIPEIQLEKIDESISKIQKFLKDHIQNYSVEMLIYTPAKGALGYAIEDTPKEDLEASLRFCFDPMVKMEEVFQPKMTLGYSALYWLPHLQGFYGSLGFVKLKMEEWALENPEKRKMIRAGTFYSQSVRGIGILLQRLAKKNTSPALQELMTEFKNSGKKFDEFFLTYARTRENEAFGKQFPEIPYQGTDDESLVLAMERILEQPTKPIVSVIGRWIWEDDALPKMPDYFGKYK